MIDNNSIFKCRVCSSDKIEFFKINHFGFLPKNNNWKSFFCLICGAVSEFKTTEKEVTYSDGSYRNNKNYFTTEKDGSNVLPPIDPWSIVSFNRWEHIWEALNISTKIFSNKIIKMLDYGGYNGYLPYALNQKISINSYVADLDKKGLKMAEFLGSKTIDLSKNKINETNFNLITMVQVLEHLDEPKKKIIELKNCLNEEGVIYAEVPNLYGFPLSDEAHKIAFSKNSLIKIFLDSGFEILNFGYTKTPNNSIKFDYFYSHEKENLFIIAGLKKSEDSFKLPVTKIPKNINEFKYKLTLSYGKIMFNKISYKLFILFLRYFRSFSLFFIYGLIEVVTLKIFRFSLISKFFKNRKN